MRFTILFILTCGLLALMACSNVKLTHANGETYRGINLRGDDYKRNAYLFQHINTSPNYDIYTPSNVHVLENFSMLHSDSLLQKISEAKQPSVIIFWYTDCPSTTFYLLQTADTFIKSQVPTYLISLNYDFKRMVHNLARVQFKYRSFIVPPKVYSPYITTKRIAYIKQLDPSFYDKFKDDVANYYCLTLNANGNVQSYYTIADIKTMGKKALIEKVLKDLQGDSQ